MALPWFTSLTSSIEHDANAIVKIARLVKINGLFINKIFKG